MKIYVLWQVCCGEKQILTATADKQQAEAIRYACNERKKPVEIEEFDADEYEFIRSEWVVDIDRHGEVINSYADSSAMSEFAPKIKDNRDGTYEIRLIASSQDEAEEKAVKVFEQFV